MKKKPTNDEAAEQLPLFSFTEYVAVGDNTFRAVHQRPVQKVSISMAVKITGKSRDSIRRLYERGFIVGEKPTPGKIWLHMDSLAAHMKASKDPEFWTEERIRKYRGE